MSCLDVVYKRLCDAIKNDERASQKRPAELFDRHPISVMLVAENDICSFPELLKITNTWKSDWLKDGVQVPTCDLSALPPPVVKKANLPTVKRKFTNFPLPEKLVRLSRDEFYDSAVHHISKKGLQSLVFYQLDNLDHAWLQIVNEERECLGEEKLQDWMLECVFEAAEEITFIKLREAKNSEDSKAIEFDENTRCDVCLSYEGEDGNELVFCDGCFVCVHQACYGIPQLPEGSWLCRRCEMGAKSTTQCILCPNTGGAMKLVDDYTSWCHVSCALWVPEVAFGDIDLMEPVSRLCEIPQARKNLICSLCRLRHGAPIQCSVKKCKVAFHVTCAFQRNLAMLQELVHGDVRLLAHCQKHSSKEFQARLSLIRSPKKEPPPINCEIKSPQSTPSKKEVGHSHCKLNDPVIANFHTLVTADDVISLLERTSRQRVGKKRHPSLCSQSTFGAADVADEDRHIPRSMIDLFLVYWRLKRRSNFNQPLIEPPESWKTANLPAPQQLVPVDVQEMAERLKNVRFGLDRARLVIDMVLQRERRKDMLLRKQQCISELQMDVILRNPDLSRLDPDFLSLVSTAHLGSTPYNNYNMLRRFNAAPESSTLPKSRPPEEKPQKSSDVENSSAGYIITGNPLVDSLRPEQLIIHPEIRERLQTVLCQGCQKRRRNSPKKSKTAPQCHDSMAITYAKKMSPHQKQQRLTELFSPSKYVKQLITSNSTSPKTPLSNLPTPRRALRIVQRSDSHSSPPKRMRYQKSLHRPSVDATSSSMSYQPAINIAFHYY